MSARLFGSEQWEKIAARARFDLAQMANICRISLRQLERDFAREFQKTPTRWVREFRCRLVLKLIAEGCANKAIVQELGFSSESHLCHEFRKVYGESPRKIAISMLISGQVANSPTDNPSSSASTSPPSNAQSFEVVTAPDPHEATASSEAPSGIPRDASGTALGLVWDGSNVKNPL